MIAAGKSLSALIRDEIRATGAISFARFMQLALYHSRHGYYASGRAELGRGGDYFTNVSVGPVFARIIGLQFYEFWKALDCPNEFPVVEQGAHHGQFALDLLRSLADHPADFRSALRYRILEPFAALANRQRTTLECFSDQVAWFNSFDEVEPFSGIHFSNELFDALPVHLLVSKGEAGWNERFVSFEGDHFDFVDRDIREAELASHAMCLPVRDVGFETEVNLEAPRLIQALATKLNRGCVLAVDYGFSRSVLLDKARVTGTLQCRANHRRLPGPFERIGESDITSHVDWTSLAEAAERADLTISGFTDQYHFLTGLLAAYEDVAAKLSSSERRGLQTLLHPEMLGRTFQVFALNKGMPQSLELSGFRFAKDPRRTLEL